MSKDGVNRDIEYEKSCYKAFRKNQTAMERSLYGIWREIRNADLLQMRLKKFRLMMAIIEVLEFTKDLMTDEEKEFFEYIKWFMHNRLVNTGSNGWARCEKSTIFVRPK